jgi:hypothetical protein
MAIAVVLALLMPAIVRWWQIDACLDASGRWNQANNLCEGLD